MPLSDDSPLLAAALPDARELPLDADVAGGWDECLLYRTGIAEGEPGTTVSAFNSSI